MERAQQEFSNPKYDKFIEDNSVEFFNQFIKETFDCEGLHAINICKTPINIEPLGQQNADFIEIDHNRPKSYHWITMSNASSGQKTHIVIYDSLWRCSTTKENYHSLIIKCKK